MAELAKVGDFCPNQECKEHGKVQTAQQQNIIKYGFTKSGRQRLRNPRQVPKNEWLSSQGISWELILVCWDLDELE